MNTHPQLSVVVPLHNEQDNVEELIQKVDKALQSYSYELILVDDCSTDKTKERVREFANEKTVLIEMFKNYGQSSALMAGIDHASGEYIVTMDGDLQNDPDDIPMMLHVLKEGDYDLVIGNRKKRKDNFLRVIFSKIANFLIRKAVKFKTKDLGCALKVFTSRTAKNLVIYGELHRFITLLAHINGAKIHQVNVRHYPRKHGKSKYGYERTIKVFLDLIIILFLRKFIQKPIYLMGGLGMLFTFLGIIILTYLGVVKFVFHQDIGTRPLLIIGVLMVLAGFQFFTIGLVLDLQMRTYYESQNKRPFHIRNVVTFENS